MTITVHVPQTIDLARIRSVHSLAEGWARVVFLDAEGHYVTGTASCSAAALRALIERDRACAEDAWAAARSLA